MLFVLVACVFNLCLLHQRLIFLHQASLNLCLLHQRLFVSTPGITGLPITFGDMLWNPRPGQIVLFRLPTGTPTGGVEMGFVLSCWRGVRVPKLFCGETSISSCPAFRAVTMDMDADHPESWRDLRRFKWTCEKVNENE